MNDPKEIYEQRESIHSLEEQISELSKINRDEDSQR